jgi:CP family cyanate transporter-like MFS transporter
VRERTGRSPARVAKVISGGAVLLAGILLLAANMRAAITSLPPLFPQLRAALHLSAASVSVLAAIPVLCFGLVSGAGAPLSRRFGEERVLGAALLLLAGGLLLRGADPGVLLIPGTVLAGSAIALLNVLLPSLVKRRRPDRAGLLIGLYLLALSAGAIVASLIAVPVFQAAGSDSGAVRLSLGLWAIPAVAAAVLWLPQLRYRTRPAPSGLPAPSEVTVPPGPPARSARPAPSAPPAPPRPAPSRGRLARHLLTWQVTAFLGLQSLTYYAAVSWLPSLFQDRGTTAATAGSLLAVMGLGNAVTALLVPWLAHRLPDQRLLSAAFMIITGAGLAGAAFGPLGGAAAFMFILGTGQGASLGLGIFYTVARAPDAATSASLSGFAQSLGYLLATSGPLALGLLHDATGGWTIPVWLLLGVIALQLVTGWLAGRDLVLPALADTAVS